MFSDAPPEDAYWVNVDGDGKMHPYQMYKTVNRADVEVTSSITDDASRVYRWVFIRHGEYEAWVRVESAERYGYEIRDDERVSEDELATITLKHNAMNDGAAVSYQTALDHVEPSHPTAATHAIIAAYYAAKADPSISDRRVDALREIVHTSTGHVDTSHVPTVSRILSEVYAERK